MTDLFGEPDRAPEPEVAEKPPVPDLFEAFVRLQKAVDAAEDEPVVRLIGDEFLLEPGQIVADAADLAAVLDAPGRHATTDPAVRRACKELGRRLANPHWLIPSLTEMDIMRGVIAAALNPGGGR